MSNLPAFAAKSMVLCAIFTCVAGASGISGEQYSKAYAVTGRPSVHVHAYNARVRILTSADPKVAFEVKYEKRDSAPQLPFSSHQDGNRVELLADDEISHSWWSWGESDYRHISIDVRMPRDADLQLETSNGAIEVSTLNGNVTLHTSNGAIHAEQVSGVVDIGSSNGAVTLEDLKGKLKVHTSNGAITARAVDGVAEFGTSNGRINVAGRFDGLNIVSSNGGVDARAESGSKVASGWSIHTSNAGIALAVPKDLKASLDASTSNGGIHLDMPVTVQGYEGKGHLHGDLNGGGAEVSMRTSNGGIRVEGV